MASRKSVRHTAIGPGRWRWARAIGRLVARLMRGLPVVLFFWYFGELVLVLLADVSRALIANDGNPVPGLLALAILAAMATAILGFRQLAGAVARAVRRLMLKPPVEARTAIAPGVPGAARQWRDPWLERPWDDPRRPKGRGSLVGWSLGVDR